MRFSTRKNEREAVMAILDDDTYADAGSMADAIVKQVYNLLLERDFYVTIVGSPDKATCFGYGLAATENEARKLAVVGPARVINITSAQRLLAERAQEVA